MFLFSQDMIREADFDGDGKVNYEGEWWLYLTVWSWSNPLQGLTSICVPEILAQRVCLSFSRVSHSHLHNIPPSQSIYPIPVTPWIVQYMLNNVLHNSGAYTKGLPVCPRPFHVLEKGGVSVQGSRFNIWLKQLPSILCNNLGNICFNQTLINF